MKKAVGREGIMPKGSSFKERLYVFLNINYEHKSRRYWLALAVPQLIFLLFLIYATGGIMIRHLYGYINHDAHISLPLTDKVLEKVAGIDVKTSQEEIESKFLRESKKAERLEPLRRFHAIIPDPTVGDKNPVCFICHGDMPHKANKKVRSLLNMHTAFVACFTCHMNEAPAGVSYKWYNASNVTVKGVQFGTKYDPKTGRLIETDDNYSKVTPMATINGVETSLQVYQDSPEAQDYVKIRDKLTPEQQGKIKAMFHKNLTGKGKFCDQCHTTDKGLINFAALGFEEMRVMDLTGLNIAGVVSKYKEFYIPTIFKTTPDQTFYKEDQPQYTDPRSWWRDKYIEKVPQKQ